MSERNSSKPSYNPGWNDPPKFDYTPNVTTVDDVSSSSSSFSSSSISTSSSNMNKPRLNLNKRVAFPLNSSTPSSSSTNVKTSDGGLPLPYSTVKKNISSIFDMTKSFFSNSNKIINSDKGQNSVSAITTPIAPPPVGPPIISSVVSSPSPTSNTMEISLTDNNFIIDNEISYENTIDLFERLLNNITKSSDQSLGIIDEIRKRLDIMKLMWLEGKINDSIKEVLFNLATALDKQQFVEANEIQRSLINHMSTCSHFAPALRQLITLLTPSSLNVEATNLIETTNTVDNFSSIPLISVLPATTDIELPASLTHNESVFENNNDITSTEDEFKEPKKFGKIQHL